MLLPYLVRRSTVWSSVVMNQLILRTFLFFLFLPFFPVVCFLTVLFPPPSKTMQIVNEVNWTLYLPEVWNWKRLSDAVANSPGCNPALTEWLTAGIGSTTSPSPGSWDGWSVEDERTFYCRTFKLLVMMKALGRILYRIFFFLLRGRTIMSSSIAMVTIAVTAQCDPLSSIDLSADIWESFPAWVEATFGLWYQTTAWINVICKRWECEMSITDY